MKTKQTSIFIILALYLSFIPYSAAQEKSLLPSLSSEQVKAIIDTASGERALNHIRQLCLHHRWFVSDGYHEAALYVKKKAKNIGLQNVKIEKFPADGKIYYGTDKSLPKWTVRSATLSLISPIRKHLVSWAENPITLASYSRSADVTAPLVDVGQGTHAADYKNKDVKAKFVLASSPQGGGRIDLVHKLAVLERGAAGVISYRSYYLDDFPDLVTWDHIWTHELDGKQSTFGFCISKRRGWELRRLLQKGEKVVLQAKIDADISPGHYEIVTGHIPGSDLAEQEIWFIAHLDHSLPSANDNASGSAAILETARTLIILIESGNLRKPRRTIRFFWVPEISGTYAYISRRLEETKRAIAVINMDMVGENQKICGSVFGATKTPDSSPSFLNDLLEMALHYLLNHPPQIDRELADPWCMTSLFGTREEWKARVTPYSGGSDHYVFMGGVINIPATMFGSWPDYFYHSSEDTPEKSDSTQLKRTVIYGAVVASSIACLDTHDGLFLLDKMFASGLKRMEQTLERAQGNLRKGQLDSNDLKKALNCIQWTAHREKQALLSVKGLLLRDKSIQKAAIRLSAAMDERADSIKKYLRNFYMFLCEEKGIRPGTVQLTEGEKAAQKIIPSRNPAFPGPISSDYIMEKYREKNQIFDFPFTGFQRFEIDAFIDGKFTILDIWNAVRVECGPLKLSDVTAYLEVLKKIGLISLKE